MVPVCYWYGRHSDAAEAVRAAGYTDVEHDGVSLFACGRDSKGHRFVASRDGQRVVVQTCCNPFGGCYVRP